MAQLLSLYILQLLFGVFWPSLLQFASADHVFVYPGQNITLSCNITIYNTIFWYQLRSEEVNLLISAKQGKLNKKFLFSYNVNESRFGITESCSLVIFGVGETDLGFYYCGDRKDETHIQFGKPIRLNFTDDHDTLLKPPGTEQSTGAEIWIISTMCLVSVLINLICMCVFCCRFTGRSVSSCSCCSTTKDSTEKVEKEENIHYASIQYKRRPRMTAKKNTSSDLDSVTYATVALQPRRH
ncbi:uncharacterized protein LOC131365019 [Hemibagrus wyckioides]|uniref:uncharacterized protein LOC131365019 n=1 Tax=Hemibagrus wyckioides TaxID=337641 RepID=UPI00266D4B71|nr:uncharacterized protein LOC131365019 [Hemibagrus wyckioides]